MIYSSALCVSEILISAVSPTHPCVCLASHEQIAPSSPTHGGSHGRAALLWCPDLPVCTTDVKNKTRINSKQQLRMKYMEVLNHSTCNKACCMKKI